MPFLEIFLKSTAKRMRSNLTTTSDKLQMVKANVGSFLFLVAHAVCTISPVELRILHWYCSRNRVSEWNFLSTSSDFFFKVLSHLVVVHDWQNISKDTQSRFSFVASSILASVGLEDTEKNNGDKEQTKTMQMIYWYMHRFRYRFWITINSCSSGKQQPTNKLIHTYTQTHLSSFS